MKTTLKVLVACEESQIVTKEFRKLGHEAYSCDLYDCSGGHPEWHFKGDVTQYLDSKKYTWDLIVAHPPCDYIANSSVQHLKKDVDRWYDLYYGVKFFNLFLDHPCKHILIENPIPHRYALAQMSNQKKYDQIIQPYQFGHAESKATCLWLKNLPKLKETNNVKDEYNALNSTPEGRKKLRDYFTYLLDLIERN